MREKVEFQSNGQTLAGLLETPLDQPLAYILFAHCFTCGKDIAAASRISKALVGEGFAVLRFDFTGLGNSDGDFANTNFSSNLQDLLSAADFLRTHYQAPQALIGHSLGGAAVLSVANNIPECKAVVTIGAPAQAEHVTHNFVSAMDEIEREGEAEVKLGLRTFKIKKQFLEDVKQHSQEMFVLNKKALLVMHSPLDNTVSIKQAEYIYQAAKHPKSFVSLDQADHLLSKKEDSQYVANVISSWLGHYLDLTELKLAQQDLPKSVGKNEIVVEEKDHKFAQFVVSDQHLWLADEPTSVGGRDSGPDPYEHLLAALGACTSMTLRMYADHKQLPLKHIKVTLSHDKNYFEDCQECQEKDTYAEKITRRIELFGELTEEQRTRLMEIADRCPVHKTLSNTLIIETLPG
ncbi:alpha/beta fold hydrolase [Litoribrevibacter euphylliae]|uniref:Alpha/beta fold hydrolase n=1 Tax=Litoribrevibacter euphylliae TaxID=1834034 RepID=A0ABV7HCI8_9GAMM